MAYDQYRKKVSSQLRFVGANNSTTFTDDLLGAFTATGNAKIDTTVPLFSGGCAIFDGSGDMISRASSAAYNFGTGDFTIDFFLRMAATHNGTILDTRSTSSDSGLNIFSFTNGTINVFTGNSVRCFANAPANGTYAHVALMRTGTSIWFAVDGVQGTVNTISSSLSITCPGSVRIGMAYDNTQSLNARIGGWRVTPGVVRWPRGSNFTPPSDQFDLRGVIVNGTVNKGSPPAAAGRKVTLLRANDNIVVGTGTSDPSTGAYSITSNADAGEMLYGVATPDYGLPPVRSQAYILNATCWVGQPSPNGHWYQCEQAGTTSATAPTWPTDGSTVTDGTVIWRDKGLMERPWCEGPYLALAA